MTGTRPVGGAGGQLSWIISGRAGVDHEVAGAVVISPNVLWNSGQNFGVWLRPSA